jgi:hypothetical protein
MCMWSISEHNSIARANTFQKQGGWAAAACPLCLSGDSWRGGRECTCLRPLCSPAPTGVPPLRSMASGPRSSILTSPALQLSSRGEEERLVPEPEGQARRPVPHRVRLCQGAQAEGAGDWNTQRESLFYYEGRSGTSATSLISPRNIRASFCMWARLTIARGSGSTGRRSASTRADTPASTAK